MKSEKIRIATRGSALAMAQARHVEEACCRAFPECQFELRIIKTTGDKLQKASMANPDRSLPKGLFTKEIEEAIRAGEAEFAVHSLKDLPTDLPEGLDLVSALKREDARDVLILKGGDSGGEGTGISRLPEGAVVATGSIRRQAQLRVRRPDLQCVEIRGNVGTRLRKLREQEELHGAVLAVAGLVRLGFRVVAGELLTGPEAPPGLVAFPLPYSEMLPCVGQAAIGLECRADDATTREICERLIHRPTWHGVTAERAFLRAMGGGCQSPVAAFAEESEGELRMEVVSLFTDRPVRARGEASPGEAEALGQRMAEEVKASETD